MTAGQSSSMSVYQEVILDHYRHPRNRKVIEDFDAESHRVNPVCGDEITVRLSVKDNIITNLGFETIGCAISVASASAMSELLEGSDTSAARSAYSEFREMFLSRSKGDEEFLGDCAAFYNLSDYPARVNCALLGWKALDEALGKVA